MDPISDLGQVIEQGQQAAANTVKNTAKNTVSDVTSAAKGQLTGANEQALVKPQVQSQAQAQNPVQISQEENSQTPLENGEFTREMVSDFYSPSSQNTQQVAVDQEQAETDAKLVKVRQELKNLHDEVYYNPLIAYENKKPEERPAERVERQQMEDLKDLQVKEQEKALPIAVKMAQTTTEINRGVAG